ncbi:amidohydrolase, partial [Francisella tularensis subsp. holarctica]|nr:amidohydrolase [Francisella tularensis subsp. holarctica]
MSKLKFSVIQSVIIWADKQANYNNLVKSIAYIDHVTDIILMCEMFNTGFLMNR